MKLSQINLLLIIGSIIVVFYKFSTEKSSKIAYVRSVYLMENYVGTKEAYQVYQEKLAKLQINMDTLTSVYGRTLDKYKKEEKTLTETAKITIEKELYRQQQNIEQYQVTMQQKQQEEDIQMTTGVFKQIDSYLKEYVAAQGYDLVLGANAQGTVLYGREAYDITEELLVVLNQKYSGK